MTNQHRRYLALFLVLSSCKATVNQNANDGARLLTATETCSDTLTFEQKSAALAYGFTDHQNQVTFCKHILIYNNRIPLGFCNNNEVFAIFKRMLMTAFNAKQFGSRAPRLFIQGSAVTNFSFRREVPFDDKSDYDIALCDHGFIDLLAQVEHEKGLNTIIRPGSLETNPLTYKHFVALGIAAIKDKLGNVAMTNIKGERKKTCTTNDRPAPRAVNFKVFRSCRDAILKGPSLDLGITHSRMEAY